MTTTERVRWERVSDGYYRSQGTRFEILYTPAYSEWIAWDYGPPVGKGHFTSHAAALAWCEGRAAEGPADAVG